MFVTLAMLCCFLHAFVASAPKTHKRANLTFNDVVTGDFTANGAINYYNVGKTDVSAFNSYRKAVIEQNNQRIKDGETIDSAIDIENRKVLTVNQRIRREMDRSKSQKSIPESRQNRSVKNGGETEKFSGRKKKKKDIFAKILPMLAIPYLIQSAILPLLLMSLKFMLAKSFVIGKLALILLVFNAFRRRNEGGDDMTNLAVQHYGYNGGDEYGAYIH